jgi:cyclopropane fatty-acyl-phospholipid synthase-like methyltransferase
MECINKNGYWEGPESKAHHLYDTLLSESLLKFFKNENVKSVADFGCGMGDYVKKFQKNGINAVGYDGNPNTPTFTDGFGKVLDLSSPVKFEELFDWVMSLEVGEHIPQVFEDNFINNLHNNNKHGILLSWAIKGQGGHGHINEQNNDYIKSKIVSLGYTNDTIAENILREKCNEAYFKKTIMVFRKNK